MANFDFKTATPDTSFPANAFLFGADSQSASDPSIYSHTAYLNYILSLANTWTAAQTIAQGTITADAPGLNGTVTWNNAGVTFTAWLLAVTQTAAASGSMLFNMTVGGTQRFAFYSGTGVTAATGIGLGNQASGGVRLIASTGALYAMLGDVSNYAPLYASIVGFAGDAFLVRDAAEVVASRNGTTAQAFRVYGTWTNASNYERGALNTGADYIELAAETAGTGDDDLDVRLTPTGTGRVRFGTHSALAAETVTGYITIKDSGGTSRKLAVVS